MCGERNECVAVPPSAHVCVLRPCRAAAMTPPPQHDTNNTHSCRAAQDAVRDFEDATTKSNGLALVLSHCNVDSQNPYLREWALLCVRHLCEGNEENQRAIAALRPQAAVQTEGLRAMGVEATLAREGGKGGPRVALRRKEVGVEGKR